MRRDVRVVEGARLESVCRGNPTVGSNPTLSANSFAPLSHWLSSGLQATARLSPRLGSNPADERLVFQASISSRSARCSRRESRVVCVLLRSAIGIAPLDS